MSRPHGVLHDLADPGVKRLERPTTGRGRGGFGDASLSRKQVRNRASTSSCSAAGSPAAASRSRVWAETLSAAASAPLAVSQKKITPTRAIPIAVPSWSTALVTP